MHCSQPAVTFRFVFNSSYKMVYICEKCNKLFARSAFVLHQLNCTENSKNNNFVVPIASQSDGINDDSSLSGKHVKTNYKEDQMEKEGDNSLSSTPQILENGSMFMVINLQNSGQIEEPIVVESFDTPHTTATPTSTTEDPRGLNCINNMSFSPNLDIDNVINDLANQSDIDSWQGLDGNELNCNDDGENAIAIKENVPSMSGVNCSKNRSLFPVVHVLQNIGNEIQNLSDSEEPNIESELAENGKGFTKRGKPRKRKAPQKNATKKTKQQKYQEKHKIQPPCNDTCKRMCKNKISEERRNLIHQQFSSMDDKERKVFVMSMVSRSCTSRKTVTAYSSRRERSFSYYLNNSEGERINVCKVFFLSTIGYSARNDSFLFNILKQPIENISPREDKRGKHQPHNFINKDHINRHILKFNPCISHYRREHAPHRKYLPCEISIKQMYDDFEKMCDEEDMIKCSYELYRKAISELNISFTKLGHEECEKCTEFKMHNLEHLQTTNNTCQTCIEYQVHRQKYLKAREKYENSVDENSLDDYNPNGTVVYSMDLQKVIMLPQMEQFKQVVFTKRIVLLNESFVPVGNKQQIKPIACIWHEGISGRKKEDIASALEAFFSVNRDAKKIVIWMDNCAALNKNWALFSYLVGLVNSARIEANEIELNYLEPGHTFMSADYFHHQVTQKMKSKGKIYDFADFEEAVQTSRNVIVRSMKFGDFFLPFDYSSTYQISLKAPKVYLSDMVQVVLKRGSLNLHFKNNFDDTLFQEKCFLKSCYVKNETIPRPGIRQIPRGVNAAKKKDIIDKLLPLMPSNRHSFWNNLETSEEPDLVTEFDA